MLRLVRLEIRKLIRKRFLTVGALGLCLIPVLAVLAIRYGGDTIKVSGSTPMNAFSVLHFALYFGMSLFFPLFASVLAADTFAGEWSEGVLRLSLLRPIRRSTLLMAKWLAVSTSLLVALILFAAVGLGLGWMVFDQNQIFLTPTETIAGWPALVRIGGMVGMSALCTAFVSAIALAVSQFITKPATAAITTVAALFSSQILARVEAVKPWLPTTYTDAWQNFMLASPETSTWKALAVLVGLTSVVLLASAIHFEKRDLEA